jgi:peptidoglycan/xylan/chitin deacetylase (PgdA/CDA1 family)
MKSLYTRISRRSPAVIAPLSCALFASVLLASCGNPEQTTPGNDTLDFSRSNLFGRSLPEKTLSLTFDDGPTPQTLPIARFLAEKGIQGTFFVIGRNAAARPGDLDELVRMGHLVANHTWDHPAMSEAGNPVSQVKDTDAEIAQYIPGNNFLFRAPYGDWAGFVADILNSNGLKKYVGPIFWDIGGELSGGYAADWACWSNGLSAVNCGEGYLREIEDKGKGIVLMHDINPKTTEMVKYIVPKLIERGYTFTRTDLVPSLASQLQALGAQPGMGAGANVSVPPVAGRNALPPLPPQNLPAFCGINVSNGSGVGNVRSAATTQSEIVAELRRGNTVQVISQVTGQVVSGSDTWYQVQFTLTTQVSGFIHGSLIDCNLL